MTSTRRHQILVTVLAVVAAMWVLPGPAKDRGSVLVLLIENDARAQLDGVVVECHRNGRKTETQVDPLAPGRKKRVEYLGDGEGVGVVVSVRDPAGARRIIWSEYVVSGTYEIRMRHSR